MDRFYVLLIWPTNCRLLWRTHYLAILILKFVMDFRWKWFTRKICSTHQHAHVYCLLSVARQCNCQASPTAIQSVKSANRHKCWLVMSTHLTLFVHSYFSFLVENFRFELAKARWCCIVGRQAIDKHKRASNCIQDGGENLYQKKRSVLLRSTI